MDSTSANAISTPLIATGCAVIVFLIFLFTIIIDTLCRRRKSTRLDKEISKEEQKPNAMDIYEAEPTGMIQKLPIEGKSQQPRGLSQLLVTRLEAAEESAYRFSHESPLDYGYEGEDASVNGSRTFRR